MTVMTLPAMVREKANSNLFEEMLPLLDAQFEEVGGGAGLALDPDWHRFLALEDDGLLRIYTMRSEGVLIGFIVAILDFQLAHKDSKVAYISVTYVDPKWRRTGEGLVSSGSAFLKWAEEEISKEGCTGIQWNIGVRLKLGVLLERNGLVKTDEIYWGGLS